MALLEIRGVVAGYGDSDVLKELDLVVEEGSLTCIVGPNGAGKSTVLKTVSGLLTPKRGKVLFQGQEIQGQSARKVLDAGIVQVLQDHSLFGEMSVEDNIRLGAYTLKSTPLIDQRLGQVYELFPNAKAWAHERASSLSGGQQRLVEFARCLMLDPKLVLLDEPSMGLDPKTLKQLFDTIRELHGSGRTILLVEQNARSGLRASTHGVVMENGRVRLSGSAQWVLENPEIGELFLGGAMVANDR